MTEISLNILDIAENSTAAGAGLIEILVEIDETENYLRTMIRDNGCGMSEDQLSHVTDPFYTTRTTRKVGLGIPFFKEAAELAGGSFRIESERGKGTTVEAVFEYTNIDRMPLGDISGTIRTLIEGHPDRDFLYTYTHNGCTYTMDTRQMREILGDVPLCEPEVLQYISEYLNENKQETDAAAEKEVLK